MPAPDGSRHILHRCNLLASRTTEARRGVLCAGWLRVCCSTGAPAQKSLPAMPSKLPGV
jgi:hypothetical protein